MSLISVVTPCYNEERNVRELIERVRAVFQELKLDYEHLFIDNASTDRTLDVLKSLAMEDKHIKIIVNTRNFGHLRSPYYGLLQARGDAVVLLVSDLQDPPELIHEFIKAWNKGFKVAIGVKSSSDESRLFYWIRKLYYQLASKLADIKLVKDFTGFGLFDRVVIESLKKIDDPYPYFRGLVVELGYEMFQIPYHQPKRRRGITKNNFYTLYDIAMLGITSHSKVPLRIATLVGLASSVLSLLCGIAYLAAKLIFWNQFTLGLAPIILGVFFFGSVQLFFIGILGEYIGFIYTQTLRRPLVVEKERINFT